MLGVWLKGECFMIRSHDDLIRIEVANIATAPIPPTDFSILSIPDSEQSAKSLMRHLFDSPTSRHTTLLLNRKPRQKRLQTLKLLPEIASIGFEYLDSVTIWYEKPTSCSNHGFLPVAEHAHLFYKGLIPDVKTTKWFGDETANATNLWGVTSQPKENRPVTYFQRFCWEIPLLLLSLTKPLEHNRFMYGVEIAEQDLASLFGFVRHFNIGVCLFAPTDQAALHIVREYESEFGNT
jgi:hypothetical protein